MKSWNIITLDAKPHTPHIVSSSDDARAIVLHPSCSAKCCTMSLRSGSPCTSTSSPTASWRSMTAAISRSKNASYSPAAIVPALRARHLEADLGSRVVHGISAAWATSWPSGVVATSPTASWRSGCAAQAAARWTSAAPVNQRR